MCSREDDPSMHDRDEDDEDEPTQDEAAAEEWSEWLDWQRSLGATN